MPENAIKQAVLLSNLYIAKEIAEPRNKSNMTQEELASRLFVSRDLVCKWETGARRPDFKTIEKTAVISGVTIEN